MMRHAAVWILRVRCASAVDAAIPNAGRRAACRSEKDGVARCLLICESRDNMKTARQLGRLQSGRMHEVALSEQGFYSFDPTALHKCKERLSWTASLLLRS